MRRLFIAGFVGAALLAGLATPRIIAKDKPAETLEQLKARAAVADKHKQAELYAELASRQLEAADQQYASNVEQAKALFLASADSAEMASQTALDANHKLKQIEIKLRELSHRMSDVRRTWAFEDRAPVDPAIQRVETARNKLLDRMFQK
jgi:hypothetical protein